jgi:glycosyltransferase involved in cell wall biosynthesis
MSMGKYHSPIRDAVKLYLNCEPGIGYRGSDKNNFRAFESDYIKNYTYGSETPFADRNGSYYDRTIPNYYGEEEFEFKEKKQDYYLYIGRMISRKGIDTAVKTCNIIGAKLIIAGQGASVRKNGHLTPNEHKDFDFAPGTWEYVGFANEQKRKELMANAIATCTPTLYLECFGGTHIESRLSGTPVLTTNFGVFPGTVENGIDGYRCDTLDDFVWAAKMCKNLDPFLIRKRAEKYLASNVKWEFQKWFEDLYFLYESTQDKNKKAWHRIREEEPEWRKNSLSWGVDK